MTLHRPAAPSVSPAQSLGGETVRHPAQLRPSRETLPETGGETPSVKALAERWFLRNAPRDRNETGGRVGVSHGMRQSGLSETPPSALDLTERAAIIQEAAKVPRDWADGFAKLEAMGPPRGVDHAAWLAVLNAAGRFLDQWGAKAAALGWTAGELFGLDPNAPLNRRDDRGAAFFLANAEVLAITAEAITLKVGGSLQSVRRRDMQAD